MRGMQNRAAIRADAWAHYRGVIGPPLIGCLNSDLILTLIEAAFFAGWDASTRATVAGIAAELRSNTQREEK